MTYSITVPDGLRYRVVETLIAADFVLEPVDTAPSQSPRFILSGDGAVPAAAKDAGLSDREMQVLRRIAQGMSNRTIGKSLGGLTEDTVKTHCQRLFRKLDVRDRAHAVHVGWQRGLLGGGS